MEVEEVALISISVYTLGLYAGPESDINKEDRPVSGVDFCQGLFPTSYKTKVLIALVWFRRIVVTDRVIDYRLLR